MANLSSQEIEIIKTLPAPFGFYRVLSGTNYLHFGFWDDKQPKLNLKEAQLLASQKIFEHLPPAPARILDIGCGLGTTAHDLAELGYEVVAIAPLKELITFAQHHYGKATYVCCGFLDEHVLLSPPQQYEVILSQESLQYFPDIVAFFSKVKSLLSPQGKMILCDEVSYSPQTKQLSAVHQVKDIEQAFSYLGFYVSEHQDWGKNVAPTCHYAVDRFQHERDLLIELFGEQSNQTIDHFLQGWRQQLAWYSKEILGYEFWVLSPSEFEIRPYQINDEHAILEAFNKAFKTQRTLEHWKWKYLNNPYGQTWIAAIWHHDKVVAHYAGYPVYLYIQGKRQLSCQALDVFTIANYRKIGHGKTALMSRAFLYYERVFCERQIVLGYGFNVNKIQRLGKMFWQHTVPTQIYQRILDEFQVSQYKKIRTWFTRFKGYNVIRTTRADDWADQIFERVKDNYGWLLIREQQYLKWRYEQHPDFKHDFFIVYYWGIPVGWIVGRLEHHRWLLGDALFDPQYAYIAFQLALNKLFNEYPQIQQLDSWFSEVPGWWNELLDKLGFIKQRQFQNLDLVAKFYLSKITAEELAQNFYFTWGDSDLF